MGETNQLFDLRPIKSPSDHWSQPNQIDYCPSDLYPTSLGQTILSMTPPPSLCLLSYRAWLISFFTPETVLDPASSARESLCGGLAPLDKLLSPPIPHLHIKSAFLDSLLQCVTAQSPSRPLLTIELRKRRPEQGKDLLDISGKSWQPLVS